MRKLSRGQYAGLTALSVSHLMGSSYYVAKRRLKKLAAACLEQNKTLSLEDIGELIHEYKSHKENKFDSRLSNYTKLM